MIHKELAVVHLGENLYVSVGVEFEKMIYLWFGYKCLLCAVPEMYVVSRYALQLGGIDRFVSVAYSFALAVRPHFLALIQQNVHVVRMEYKAPESGPVVAGPDVETLVVTQGINAPAGQGEQRGCVHYCVADAYLVTFQYAGEYLAAQREPIGNIQLAAKVLLYIFNYLHGLVIDGCEL